MMLANAREALAALGKAVGVRNLDFGVDGVACLLVGKDLALDVEEVRETGTIRLTAVVRAVLDADASVFRELLAANFAGQGTGNAAFALNRDSGEFVLTQPVDPKGHTAESFHAEVDAFVRHALFWMGRASALRPEAEVASGASGGAAEQVTFRL